MKNLTRTNQSSKTSSINPQRFNILPTREETAATVNLTKDMGPSRAKNLKNTRILAGTILQFLQRLRTIKLHLEVRRPEVQAPIRIVNIRSTRNLNIRVGVGNNHLPSRNISRISQKVLTTVLMKIMKPNKLKIDRITLVSRTKTLVRVFPRA